MAMERCILGGRLRPQRRAVSRVSLKDTFLFVAKAFGGVWAFVALRSAVAAMLEF